MKIAILTSGGDAPGMNAAIRAAVRCSIDYGMEVYGIDDGFEGLLDEKFVELSRRSVADILHKGGTMLRTARSKRFMEPKWIDYAADILRKWNIDGLIIIGGNGSLKGALELSKRGIKVVGIPCTIDNDLGYTDFTIGFDTAVTTVLDAVSKIRDTSQSHSRSLVIEVMGRDNGDIAIYSGICGGAEYVLTPEKETRIEDVATKIKNGVASGKRHSIIINAEGSGIDSKYLSEELTKLTGRDVKYVNLSYLQRGGSPTANDRLLATLTTSKAVDVLNSKELGSKAIGTSNGKIVVKDLEEALKEEKHIDPELFRLVDVLSK